MDVSATVQRAHSLCHLDFKTKVASVFFITTLVLAILCYQPQLPLKILSSSIIAVQSASLLVLGYLQYKKSETNWKKVAALTILMFACLIGGILGTTSTISMKTLGAITLTACSLSGFVILYDYWSDLRKSSMALKRNWMEDAKAYAGDSSFKALFEKEKDLYLAMQKCSENEAPEVIAEFEIKARLYDPIFVSFFGKNPQIKCLFESTQKPYVARLAPVLASAGKIPEWEMLHATYLASHPSYALIARRRSAS